jgi:hypothetical protein
LIVIPNIASRLRRRSVAEGKAIVSEGLQADKNSNRQKEAGFDVKPSLQVALCMSAIDRLAPRPLGDGAIQ